MSRIPPSKVAPVTIGSIRYQQDQSLPGYLFAVGATSGELFFVTQIYPQIVIEELEADVQEVWMTSLHHDKGAEELVITNELGQVFRTSIRAKERGSDWPVEIRLANTEVAEGHRTILITIEIRNLWDVPLQLDPLSVCQDGQLQNNLFKATLNGTKIDYRGMMKKRAPPSASEFVTLEPGQVYTGTVDIAGGYRLPRDAHGTVTVQMETFNHFTANMFHLISNIVQFELPAAP